MDEKQIEELARQLAEDIESGKPVSTFSSTPPPEITEEKVREMRKALEPEFFRAYWRLHYGIDWGHGHRGTIWFPET